MKLQYKAQITQQLAYLAFLARDVIEVQLWVNILENTCSYFICGQCSYFIPPENTREPKVSQRLRGYKIGTLDRDGLKCQIISKSQADITRKFLRNNYGIHSILEQLQAFKSKFPNINSFMQFTCIMGKLFSELPWLGATNTAMQQQFPVFVK